MDEHEGTLVEGDELQDEAGAVGEDADQPQRAAEQADEQPQPQRPVRRGLAGGPLLEHRRRGVKKGRP